MVIILLLANTIFAPVVSASSAGGGNNKRTVYAINYDVQMQSYSASNSSKFPVHAGGEERYRIINTYPGTNRNTVKNSIYTITVPDSIDFTSIKDFSLLGENIRGFTSGSYNWLNEEKTSYIMDPSLYTVISDEASRTITVTIPNTSDWTSINSTSFQFSYTAPSNEENNITWNTSVYSAGGTYELVDNMEFYNDLLVHYVDQDNNSVAEDTVVTDRFGTSYSATSYKKVIDGYAYDRVEGDTTATIGPNIPELTLVYSKNVVAGADVTIKYVDEENQSISGVSDKIISGNVGDDYDASTSAYKLIIDGYTLDESKLPENAIGKLGEQAQTVTYVYNKNKAVGSVTLRYVDTFGQPIEDFMFGNDVSSMTFKGEVGNSADDDLAYLDVPGWVLISKLPTGVVYSETPQTFDIVYDNAGTIYVNYEDTNGVKLKPEWRNTDYLSQFDWTTGQFPSSVAYEVFPLDIPGYEMIRVEGDAAKGDIEGHEIKHVTFVYSKPTMINIHDSNIYVGDKWSAEDNFDSAFDKDGKSVDFKDIKITGDVDTSKAGTYEVTYSYDGIESKATVTVKDKQTAVNVHDSIVYVGDEWTAENNFDSAFDKDGKPVDFEDITVTGDVDTTKAGTYEVTYSIPEEHWGRGLVEGYHTATAKIVVSEEENKDNNDSDSKGEESNSDKDNLSSTDELSGENNTQNTKDLPTTGEHTSALIFMIGIALLLLGSIFGVLRIKKNKK
ncbi:bacterial Ig-like domain-containing protein [Lactococcus garvieae]